MSAFRKVGPADIFALGDTFDEILRQLSPDYFQRSLHRLRDCLVDDAEKLALGWMHPGYAVIYPDDNHTSCEPATLFGWLSVSGRYDPSRPKKHTADLAARLHAEKPRLLWATCSARAYQYIGVAVDDCRAALDLFIDLALDEPTDWSVTAVAPSGDVPDVVWKRLCFAVAHDDQSLEHVSWQLAKEIYSPVAISLLKEGVKQTLKCVRPT